MKNKTNLSMSRKLSNSKVLEEIRKQQQVFKKTYEKADVKAMDIDKDQYERQAKHIATLDARRTHNFATDLNDSIYILGGSDSKFKPKGPYMDSTAPTTRIYENLYKNNIFQDIQNFTQSVVKKQSGAEHINKTIELNQLTSIAFNKTKGNGTATFDMVKSSADRLKHILSRGSGHIITYDTETLGGTNAYGHNQIDFITEVSATVRKLNGKNSEEIESLTSILGFSDAEYKKYKKYIENIDMNNLSNKDQVWLHRLGIYGHSDTKLDLKTDVFEQRMVAGADGSIVKGTKEEALKGLEVLREVGIKQEAYLKSIGGPDLETYRQNYLENFADLIYNGKGLKGQYNDFVTVGFNNVNFDNQMLNRTTGKNLRPQPGRHLDLYQGILYGNEYLGRSSAHIPGFKVSNEFGVTQQEGIARAYGYFDELAGGAAHTAKKDEETLFNMLVSNVKGTDDSLSLLEVNQMTGSKAFNRFIKKNNKYGQFIDGTFVMGHGITPYELSRGFEEFSVNDYLRPNPGIESADYYGDEIFNEYKKLFGSKKGAREKVAQKYAQLNAQNQSYFDHIYKNLIAVEKMTTDSSGYYNSPNEVFMMNSTGAKSWQNEQGALSFVYDPVSGNYKTFNGYTINKDTGKVGKEDFNQWGPKNNALYQHSVYEMNIKDKDKWKEMFGHGMSDAEFDEFFQEYSSLDKLYLIKSKEYMDKEKLVKQYGKDSVAEIEKEFYTIVTDPDKIGTMLGTAIGQDNGNGLEAYEEAIKSLTPKVMKTGADGKVVIEDLSGKPVGDIVDMLVERSMDRTIVDSAGRAIRDNNYRRLATLRELQKQNGGNISQLLAEAVALNKKLDIPLTEALINELGYVKPGTNYKTITPETIRNSTVLDKYLEATGQAFDAIEEIMTKEFGQTLKVDDGIVNSVEGSSTIWAKKNMAYNYAWNNTMEQLAAEVGESIPEVMGNYKDLLLTNEDLNVIDFKFEDLFPEKAAKRVGKSYANANTEYVTLNLNKNDALLKLFYNNKFENNQRVSAKTNAGFDALFTAFETINNDERFKGINIWGDLTKDNFYEYQNFNVSQLGDYMQQKLKEAVIAQRSLPGNEGFGFGFARRYQDVSNPALQAKVLETVGIDRFKEVFAENVKKSIHNISYASNAKTNGDFVNEIIDKYFMTFTKADLEEQIKNLPAYEQKVARMQYEKARTTSQGVVEDLLASINGKDMDFFITGSGKNATFNLMQGNKIEQLNLEQYSLRNGMIVTTINGNDYASRLGYDVSGHIKYGHAKKYGFNFKDSIQVGNTVKLATSDISFNQAANRAVKSGGDIFDAIVRTAGSRAGRITNSTARLDSSNYAVFEQSMKFDFNGLISILPELQEAGVITQANNSPTLKNNKEAQDLMEAFIKQMRENDKNGKPRVAGLESMLASDKVSYFMNYHEVISNIVNQKMIENSPEELADILRGISTLNKNTSVGRGYGSMGEHYPHPLAKFDNISRPPVNQMGKAVLYDSESVKENIKKIKTFGNEKGNAVFDSKNFAHSDVVTGDIAEKYLNNAGGKYSAGLTMRYLQTDKNSISNLVKGDVVKARNGEESRFSKFIDSSYKDLSKNEKIKASQTIAERTMMMTTHEQQSMMNARIYDAKFYRDNTQQINFKKQLIIEHSDNLAVIEGVKNAAKVMYDIDANGNIVYNIGTKIKRNEFIGAFETGNIQAKQDGVLRLRYFDEYNNVVSEKELNKLLKAKGFNAQEFTDPSMAIAKANDILSGTYTLKYEVLGKNQLNSHKAFLGPSEKTTLAGMHLQVGEIDSRLALLLQEAGHGDLIGNVTNLSYINEYLIPSLDGNQNKEEIINRLFNERYAWSDALQNFEQFNGVGIISNVDVGKHTSVSFGIENTLNTLRMDGKLNHEYLSQIFDDYKLLDENGNVIEKGSNTAGYRVDISNSSSIRESQFVSSLKSDATEAQRAIAEDLEKITSSSNAVTGLNNAGESINIGNRGLIHVHQVMDDSAGSYASNANLTELGQELVHIDREIAKLTKEANAAQLEGEKIIKQRQIATLVSQRNEIEIRMSSAVTKEKGLKFSSRMNMNLQNQVYGNDTFKLAQEKYAAMGLQDEFNALFGHAVNADGTIKASKLGSSILDPITSRLRDTMLLEDGAVSLAQLDELSPRDRHRYAYLKEYFPGLEDKISINKAEKIFSYTQGTKALDYNLTALGYTGGSLSNARNKLLNGSGSADSFKVVDLSSANPFIDREWLQLDIGGQGNTIIGAENNPYAENLLIKTGLGGKYEELAIGRMPELHFEDALIKQQHITKLSSFQEQLKIINNVSSTQADIDKARENAIRIFEDIVQAQKHDVNSKDGLYGQIRESRMQRSFFGKGSGMQINALLDGGKDYVSNLAPAGSDAQKAYYKKLQDANGKFFDRAMFNGKSILEHYSEGKVIDHFAAGREAFAKMGYFNEDFMADIIGNMDPELLKGMEDKSNQEIMEHLLSTKGDAFIATRFPEIMEGSDKVVMGYLDTTLADNEMRVYGATGASMKMDFDGDMGGFATITTKDGNSRLSYMVGAANDAETVAMVNAQDAYIGKRAVNENRAWEDAYQAKMAKEYKVGVSKAALTDIAAGESIDGKLIAAYIPNKSQYSLSEMNEAKVRFEKLLNMGDNQKAADYLKDNFKEFGAESYEEAIGDYTAAYLGQRHINANTAKIFNSQVGEANVTQYKVREAVIGLLDKSADDYQYRSMILNDLLYQAEEQSISAKSSVEGLSALRSKEWNTAVTEALKGENVTEHIQTIRNWAEEYTIKDANLNMYYESSKMFKDFVDTSFNISSKAEFLDLMENDPSARSRISTKIIGDLADTIQGVSEVKGVGTLMDYLSVGNSQSGVGTKRSLNAILTDFENADKRILEVLETDELLGNFINVTKLSSQARAYQSTSAENAIDGFISKSESSAGKTGVMHDILEGAGDLFKSAKGSSLAKAAVGIAAGVMVAGFVGGRPRPADTQAMEEAQDYAPMDGPMMLADPSLGGMVPSSNGGYVVNINARTDKGRQHAVNAIQQAISSGTSSSVNISMNIHDNYGNITDREIEKAIESAFS